MATETGLAEGTYTVTVTDANACTAIAVANVIERTNCNPICELTITTEGSDETCIGNDGSASVTVLSGSGNYFYLWSNGGTGTTITGLSEGTYTVTVIDLGVANCVQIQTIVIGDGCGNPCDITLSVNSTNEECADGTGTITASVGNGTAPYTYAWSTNGMSIGGTSAQITGLSAGLYSVTVRDVEGCEETDSIEILDICPCELTTRSDKSCLDLVRLFHLRSKDAILGL